MLEEIDSIKYIFFFLHKTEISPFYYLTIFPYAFNL